MFGYINEITKFLKTICNCYGQRDWFSPYFMYVEPLSDFEKEQYPNAIGVSCFRSLGYTMGHVYVDKDMNILDFYVYERNECKDYEMSETELQDELNKRFKGTKLILDDREN